MEGRSKQNSEAHHGKASDGHPPTLDPNHHGQPTQAPIGDKAGTAGDGARPKNCSGQKGHVTGILR